MSWQKKEHQQRAFITILSFEQTRESKPETLQQTINVN